MALVRIPEKKQTLSDPLVIARYLQEIGIQYERWKLSTPIPDDAPADEVLAA